MSLDIIKTIQEVGVEVMNEHALQIIFGKVKSTNPLEVAIGENFILTEEFIVLDSMVEVNEEVVIIKFSVGNKYLVLSTVEKLYGGTVYTGGIIGTDYSTSGKWKSLGTFTVTHYCCEKYPHICNNGAPYKTAMGTEPHIGGCAVDTSRIPLGSFVKINGVVYHAEDTGGAINGNRIDLVVGTHKEALEKGTYNAEVFLKVGD